MYHAYQAHSDLMAPVRGLTNATVPLLDAIHPGFGRISPARRLSAAYKTFSMAEVTHRRRPFDIPTVVVEGREVGIKEVPTHTTPFATLLHFRKASTQLQPKVLIAAPMSGHFATLLRDTVRTMLTDHDVYITDWHNAREVPLAAGRFGLDEYTAHLIEFLEVLGPGASLVSICQPCVASLAAVAVMSEDNNPATPASLVLMAGPIDCRISPTGVNKLASSKDIRWFEKNLISTVPWQHLGAGRRVYPGFIQLTAFMSMNTERHRNAFREYYEVLCEPEPDVDQVLQAEATRNFYQEYLAVADLPAEFYLETVEKIFQTYDLPRGELSFQGRRVNPAAIRRTALMTVEGERDDICAVGQTLAAQDLCSNLRPYMRTHYVQAGAGHYGVFSGKRWQGQIYPLVRQMIQVSQ